MPSSPSQTSLLLFVSRHLRALASHLEARATMQTGKRTIEQSPKESASDEALPQPASNPIGDGPPAHWLQKVRRGAPQLWMGTPVARERTTMQTLAGMPPTDRTPQAPATSVPQAPQIAVPTPFVLRSADSPRVSGELISSGSTTGMKRAITAIEGQAVRTESASPVWQVPEILSRPLPTAKALQAENADRRITGLVGASNVQHKPAVTGTLKLIGERQIKAHHHQPPKPDPEDSSRPTVDTQGDASAGAPSEIPRTSSLSESPWPAEGTKHSAPVHELVERRWSKERLDANETVATPVVQGRDVMVEASSPSMARRHAFSEIPAVSPPFDRHQTDRLAWPAVLPTSTLAAGDNFETEQPASRHRSEIDLPRYAPAVQDSQWPELPEPPTSIWVDQSWQNQMRREHRRDLDREQTSTR